MQNHSCLNSYLDSAYLEMLPNFCRFFAVIFLLKNPALIDLCVSSGALEAI